MSLSFRCMFCKHLQHPGSSDNRATCTAFPEAIPMEILKGPVSHLEPYPGDHGIQFEPNPRMGWTREDLVAYGVDPADYPELLEASEAASSGPDGPADPIVPSR